MLTSVRVFRSPACSNSSCQVGLKFMTQSISTFKKVVDRQRCKIVTHGPTPYVKYESILLCTQSVIQKTFCVHFPFSGSFPMLNVGPFNVLLVRNHKSSNLNLRNNKLR